MGGHRLRKAHDFVGRRLWHAGDRWRPAGGEAPPQDLLPQTHDERPPARITRGASGPSQRFYDGRPGAIVICGPRSLLVDDEIRRRAQTQYLAGSHQVHVLVVEELEAV